MCGLAGILRREAGDPAADGRLAAALDDLLSHRGPDGKGFWRSPDGRALLVHRRLAIVDLSEGGAQPMASPDGRWRIVFNGEIYGHGSLRRRMESAGETFRTRSDTEVLLRAMARDGTAALAGLRGMFAFALHDASDGSVLLARDRFGIKPLYVAETPGGLAFSSEVGALRASGLARGGTSPEAVWAYLLWGVVPPPLAWVRGVRALLPGEWLRWHPRKGPAGGRFADLREAFLDRDEEDPGAEGLTERVAASVRESVAAHLVADVPVGVFLSGGVDSGALVSAARSSEAREVRTFTVTFAEREYSEARVAAAVARKFGTTHREVPVDGRDVREALPRILARMDQPTADGVNTWFVARAVAGAGARAVLSGTGGDEMFGGYPSFVRIPRALAAGRSAAWALRAAGAAAAVLGPARRRAQWRHLLRDPADPAEVYRAQRGLFMPEEAEALAGPRLLGSLPALQEEGRERDRQRLAPLGAERPHAAVARMETVHYLSAQLLRDIDVMSMAHSLEVRVPFADPGVLAATWPAAGRRPGLLRGKRILHRGLRLPLPPAAVRGPKRGFTLPFERWMRGELREPLREGIEALCRDGWVDADAAGRVRRAWERGKVHWSRPWALGILGLFLEGAGRPEEPQA